MKRLLLFLASVSLAGCAAANRPPSALAGAAANWRAVATEADRERLRDWRGAFTSALRSASAGGHAGDIAREGALLQPDSALGGGPIPDGLYRCRVIKLGARSEGLLDYVAYPHFRCRIQAAGPVQAFAKLSGSQRQVGRIFPGDAMRQVFLGTLLLGDEARAMQYGVDPERDVAGFVERVGPRRWRLVMPWPHFESRLDVLELIPET